jgi:hypothetical protein
MVAQNKRINKLEYHQDQLEESMDRIKLGLFGDSNGKRGLIRRTDGIEINRCVKIHAERRYRIYARSP